MEAVFAFGAVAATVQAVGVLYLLLIPNPALLFTAAPFAVMSVINMPFTLMMFASLAAIVAGQAILACHDTSGPSQTKEFDFVGHFIHPFEQLARFIYRSRNSQYLMLIRLTVPLSVSGHNSIIDYPNGREKPSDRLPTLPHAYSTRESTQIPPTV